MTITDERELYLAECRALWNADPEPAPAREPALVYWIGSLIAIVSLTIVVFLVLWGGGD